MTGPMLAQLWLAAGAGTLAASVGLARSGAPVAAVTGGSCVLLGVILLRLPWDRVPPALPRCVPWAACATTTVLGVYVPGLFANVIIAVATVMAWTGVALGTVDIVITTLLCSVALSAGALTETGVAGAIWIVPAMMPLLTILAVTMRRLRVRIDEAADEAIRVQADNQREREAAVAARLRAEQERAAAGAADLARRMQAQSDLAGRATELALAASGVTGRAAVLATSVEGLSQALGAIAGTAQTTDAISGSVADTARSASAAMQRLEQTATQIGLASDLIRSIAEQTDLLALNATIESARAGEAGHGFAVVASEVKELARQAGKNADTIGRTIGQVRAEVQEAGARVEEITQRMAALRLEYAGLATAIDEQTTVLHTVAADVGAAARDARQIEDGVRDLVDLSAG